MLTKIKITLLASITILLLTGCGGSIWQTGKKAEVIEARAEIFSAQAEPNNIVLMLPLKGELAASSQAIRNGFLAAYHHYRKERPSINIKVIDTTGGDVRALYQQAVIDGAEVIVGPLTKKEVEIIASINPLPIPTLALNTLDDYTHSFGPNLYQFGLLPQDEAWQVATKMIQEQHDRVAIIAPENAWGDKIVAAFRSKYEESGGQVIATLNYRSSGNLAEQICPFLAQDATKLCTPRKHKDKKQEVSNEPMRRQDINAIFLVTKDHDHTARQIMPLLKFYYAGDLPTYSISTVYTGVVSQNLDQDLEGVYFCDMPWVLQDPSVFGSDLQAIHKQIMVLWADSYANLGRLYALGVDAYNLASKLNGFLNSPQYGVEGASGKLYLNEFNHIYRELQWAQMKNGFPIVLQ